jgi:hypothetical protein
MITICAKCQEEQKLTPYIIKATETGVQFKQGLCARHYVLELVDRGKSKKQIEVQLKHVLSSFKPPPDLKKRPDLVKQYKKKIFKEL